MTVAFDAVFAAFVLAMAVVVVLVVRSAVHRDQQARRRQDSGREPGAAAGPGLHAP